MSRKDVKIVGGKNMKRADLEALNLEKEAIDKIMDMNGADIEAKKAEINTLKTQLKESKESISELNEKLKDVDSKDETIGNLKKQIDDMVQAEKDREENERKKKADDELTERIVSAFPEGVEFTSDYAKNGVIADIKSALKEDATLGVKEIFESLTKDKEGIFKNKQHEKLKIPGTSSNTGEDDEKPKFKSFF